jgi:hypothetical protein
VRRRALDPLTIPGAGFVVNQAAKRFGAPAKPFSEAREGIPKLSPVNPKTVARETGFRSCGPFLGRRQRYSGAKKFHFARSSLDSMGANDAASGNAPSMGTADVGADNCQCRHVFDHLPSD